MSTMFAKKRRSRFALLALVGLTLGTILASAPTASAQFGFGLGGFNRGYGGYNRGYGYNRGFNGYNGYNRFRPGFYNRGYGYRGYGPGFYNPGIYGGGLNIGIGTAPFLGTGIYGGSYGGYY